MFDKIKFAILRWFAKDFDAIIKAFTKMDAQLDAYIAKERAKASEADQVAAQLRDEADIRHLNADRAAKVKQNLKAITN